MHRRKLLQCAIAVPALALPHKAAHARDDGYTPWSRPNVAPYSGDDALALRLFKDSLDRFAVYEDFSAYVLGTPPMADELKIPYGEDDVRYARMTFAAHDTVSNLVVTPADLAGAGWAGQTRATQVWTRQYSNGQVMLIVMYTMHMVCKNRSLFMGFAQGKCIWDEAICGPRCAQLRRLISS